MDTDHFDDEAAYATPQHELLEDLLILSQRQIRLLEEIRDLLAEKRPQ